MKVILKTIPYHEFKNFIGIMDEYCNYLIDPKNKNSLIGRILGVYEFNW